MQTNNQEMSSEMREAFEAWAREWMNPGVTNGLARKESGEYLWSGTRLCFDVWQAATAAADAKYLGVIEKLTRECEYAVGWMRGENRSRHQEPITRLTKAIALAAPLLGGK